MANGNFAGGTGVEGDPYLIEDAFDLDAVRNDLTAHYKLINDIDLDIAPFNEGEGWVPISTFSGLFDGDGHIVKNLYIKRVGVDFQALFGRTSYATIKNLGLEDINVTGGYYVGGLVGLNTNSTVANCYCVGNIVSKSYTAVLVGDNTSSTIVNCYSVGNISGSHYIGGLVGRNEQTSLIKNCFATVSVNSSSENSGGLAGRNTSSSITNSFWDTETSGMTISAGGTGLTTIEMQNPQTFINAGWDLEELEDGRKIWKLNNGEYPKLFFENAPPLVYLFKNTLKKLQFGFQEPENENFKYKVEWLDKEGNIIETFIPETDYMAFAPNGGKIKIE